VRTPPQILIVEDNPESLDIFQTRLAAHGYEILTASDGEEALAIAREKQPDLILLDIMMPKLNGVEVCRRLKEDPSLPFMPIVMVTALADPKDVVVGLEAGADEYLAKPVDQTALVARVKSMLRIKSLHDTGQEQAARLEAQAIKLSEWNQKLEERVNEQVKRIGRLDRLKRFLSPHVAELVTESNNESLLESHRQYITTLFCDLRGFTAFSENIEPEESMELLRSYHEEIGRLVFKFDGTIDHRAGDGLMVIFNDPVPCDAHVEQALNLAFAMRDRVRELDKVWQKRGYKLGFGIGITSGYATLGIVGFEGRFDYTANGNVVNLAARLCDIAKNDQIIISQNVYSEIENLVDAKPLPDLHLKGIRRPVRAFSVVRLRKNPGAITGSEAVGSPDCG
jgi:adenylate cyclase